MFSIDSLKRCSFDAALKVRVPSPRVMAKCSLRRGVSQQGLQFGNLPRVRSQEKLRELMTEGMGVSLQTRRRAKAPYQFVQPAWAKRPSLARKDKISWLSSFKVRQKRCSRLPVQGDTALRRSFCMRTANLEPAVTAGNMDIADS